MPSSSDLLWGELFYFLFFSALLSACRGPGSDSVYCPTFGVQSIRTQQQTCCRCVIHFHHPSCPCSLENVPLIFNPLQPPPPISSVFLHAHICSPSPPLFPPFSQMSRRSLNGKESSSVFLLQLSCPLSTALYQITVIRLPRVKFDLNLRRGLVMWGYCWESDADVTGILFI